MPLATLVDYGGTHAGSANSAGVRLISEKRFLVIFHCPLLHFVFILLIFCMFPSAKARNFSYSCATLRLR